ncbi:membrane protein [Paramixta manurensis]|uniref:Membrane protein n=1 Tax=Paramixta manurensis TaxID=2740817 RepID=A0A6M8U7D3_9GAMM|nr:membrane protein [Erwiniaceae bacterium PD-1]
MVTLFKPFLHDRFLHLMVILGIVLAIFAPFRLTELPGAVDWHTLITLCGLLILTKGIELSGYFEVLGRRVIEYFQHQRALALALVAGAALLSTFLTNDVALFIVVPLTLTLRKFSSLPVSRLIIFEALAVNAGSLLTPIGNPQNILLWGHSDLSFFGFIWQMLPLASALMVCLLALTWFCFPDHIIQRHAPEEAQGWQRRLLWLSVLLYLLFIAALECRFAGWALIVVIAAYLLMARQVLLRIDWSLLTVFIAMFIDVFLLTRLPGVHAGMTQAAHWSDGARYLAAIGLSQVISNVPATILLLPFMPASQLFAWAVNIGGFGLLPGSLANLIALRMAKERRIWWQFHLFSLPMLLIALVLGWLIYLTLRAA